MKFKYTEKEFQHHIESEHRFSLSGYLKEIVYGASDGIVTTFAVVAGFTGAQSGINQFPVVIVLIFGFANLLADAFSMGLGNVLSILADKDVYKTERDKELYEIKNNPEFEKVLDGARLLFGGIKDIHSKKGLEEITSRYINHKERLKSIGPKYE